MRMSSVFFFNDTATTEIYTLSLHDALPICHQARARPRGHPEPREARAARPLWTGRVAVADEVNRSEEHTSELQSRQYLVCRLLLEKKQQTNSVCTTYVPIFALPTLAPPCFL